MRKKFLPKLVIASLLVGGVNFLPAVVNFNAENLQIVSVAYASVENVTASGRAIFNFGEDDTQIVNTVKNVAKMRATQAAKEKAGVYIKSQTKTVNGVLTDDDISAYTSNNIQILDVKYKKIPVQAHDVKGNDTGEIAFMYEAVVAAKIDTSGITAYVKRDDENKQKIVQQNKFSQQNISKISSDFDNLRNSSKNIEKIKSEFNNIDNEILAQQKYDEGKKFYYEKNYKGAISKFTEAIELNPNYTDAYFFRGGVYHNDAYNREAAILDYDKAIKLNPNSAEAFNERGRAYKSLKNYEQAIEDFNQAIKLINRENIHNHFNYAEFNRESTYEHFKAFEREILEYTQYINSSTDDDNLYLYFDAYEQRGIAYRGLKKYNKAIEDFTQIIKLLDANKYIQKQNDKPFSGIPQEEAMYIRRSAYLNRGIAYYYLKNYKKAMEDFSKYVQLDPNDVKNIIYFYRGKYYQSLGKNDLAEADFAKVRELGWKD